MPGEPAVEQGRLTWSGNFVVIKRAAAHSGTLFPTLIQNGAFSWPGAYLDARFAFYAKSWPSGAFRLLNGVEEDPMCGETLHLGCPQPGRPLGGRIGKPDAARISPPI